MAGGRPSSYTAEIGDLICAEISSTTKSLRTICQKEGMPDVVTLLRWVRTNEEFRKQYARAKEEQADMLVEDMLEIADDGSRDDTPFTGGNHVQRDKLKVDTRKWIAAKLKPKKYGDKLDLTSDGDKIQPSQVNIIPVGKDYKIATDEKEVTIERDPDYTG